MLVLTDDLGKGFGPFVMALLIIALGSRRDALSTAVIVGVTLSASMQAAPFFTVEEDEAETNRRVLAGEGPPSCCLD